MKGLSKAWQACGVAECCLSTLQGCCVRVLVTTRCNRIHTYTRTHSRTHARTHAHTQTPRGAACDVPVTHVVAEAADDHEVSPHVLRLHTYVHTSMHTYVHTYMHASMHPCIHACIHAYVHTNICTYTHTHTYTHTNAHTNTRTKYTHIHRGEKMVKLRGKQTDQTGAAAPRA